MDDDVTNNKGIYIYLLTGEEKHLNIRVLREKENYVSTTNKAAYALNAVITSRILIWMVTIFFPGQKEEKRNMITSKCFVFHVIEVICDNQKLNIKNAEF